MVPNVYNMIIFNKHIYHSGSDPGPAQASFALEQPLLCQILPYCFCYPKSETNICFTVMSFFLVCVLLTS